MGVYDYHLYDDYERPQSALRIALSKTSGSLELTATD